MFRFRFTFSVFIRTCRLKFIVLGESFRQGCREIEQRSTELHRWQRSDSALFLLRYRVRSVAMPKRVRSHFSIVISRSPYTIVASFFWLDCFGSILVADVHVLALVPNSSTPSAQVCATVSLVIFFFMLPLGKLASIV